MFFNWRRENFELRQTVKRLTFDLNRTRGEANRLGCALDRAVKELYDTKQLLNDVSGNLHKKAELAKRMDEERLKQVRARQTAEHKAEALVAALHQISKAKSPAGSLRLFMDTVGVDAGIEEIYKYLEENGV